VSSPSSDWAWFDEFYRSNYKPVMRFLAALGAEMPEAEDALQSAMELLLKSWASVRDRKAWIRVVARNEWIRAMRRASQDLTPPAPPLRPARSGPLALKVDPADVFFLKASRDSTIQTINALPPAQRRMVTYLVDGYRPSEIAALTGSRPELVRSHLTHARRRLRQHCTSTRQDRPLERPK